MKSLIKPAKICLTLILLSLAVLVVRADPPKMVDFPLPKYTLTNAESYTTTARIPIPIEEGCRLYIQSSIVASAGATSTSNLVFKLYYGADARTWNTTAYLQFTNNLTGTTTKISTFAVGTNIPGQFVAIGDLSTTHTNTVTVNSFKAIWVKTTEPPL